MATQLNARLVHPQLRGRIGFNSAARIRHRGEEVGLDRLLAALSPANVLSLEAGDSPSTHPVVSHLDGATISLKNAGSYAVEIGLPGRPGRVFRFIPSGEFGSGVVVRLRTSRSTGSAYNRITGSILRGSATAGVNVQQFVNRRSINVVGQAAAANRPDKSDFIEFLDLGTRWHLRGVCHSSTTNAIQGV